MSKKVPTIEVKDIDHCGIVAGIVDEIGLVEQINQELGIHPQEKISAGIAVKAMIINGLGLVSAPLYLFEKFFVGKATEHLLGEGIKAEYLNNDRLGRVLDKLYEAGGTLLFVKIALSAASRLGVKMKNLHLDSSSFHVHGKYIEPHSSVEEEVASLAIVRGYSRDHRPDLKQFMVDLICSGDGDVPVYLRVGNGNESDQAIFGQLIREFKQQWDEQALFVADAALYSEDNIQSLGELRWLARVPATLKAAQELMEQLPEEVFYQGQEKGYRWSCVCNSYGGIPQRWLVVESEARKEADLKHLESQIIKHLDSAQKQFKQLQSHDFACAPDALAAAEQLQKQWRYHHLEGLQVVALPHYTQSGRPRKGQEPESYRYRLQGTLTLKEEVVSIAQTRAGRFILATNVLDSQSLGEEQMLLEYKEQQCTERGFRSLGARSLGEETSPGSHRFLKDPLFFTSSVFLKTPQRVAALAMVMALCLLVYTLAQRTLRQSLARSEQTIANQSGQTYCYPYDALDFSVFSVDSFCCS